MVSIHSTRNNLIGLFVIGLFVGTIALPYNSGALGQRAMRFEPAPVAVQEGYAARGTESNEGLLRQAARHLSKMERGASIGGFPGFEPPKDDKEYRRKIEQEEYTPQDVNDWVQHISKSLEQVAKKNPGKALEKILQEQGKPSKDIGEFLDTLRQVHFTADSMKAYGVSAKTVERLEAVMKTLGVSRWTY